MKFDVWYMQPTFFRDGLMGADFLRARGKLPVQGELDKTHIFLSTVEAPNLESLYHAMQGEHWSPNGEARGLIQSKGLQHTSMSVGDVAVNSESNQAYIVDQFGFVELATADRPIVATDEDGAIDPLSGVAVVDEEHPGGPKVVARVGTVKEAEEWVANQEKVDPDKVHRGGYGIDECTKLDNAETAGRTQFKL